jgi:hypothetical protein
VMAVLFMLGSSRWGISKRKSRDQWRWRRALVFLQRKEKATGTGISIAGNRDKNN